MTPQQRTALNRRDPRYGPGQSSWCFGRPSLGPAAASQLQTSALRPRRSSDETNRHRSPPLASANWRRLAGRESASHARSTAIPAVETPMADALAAVLARGRKLVGSPTARGEPRRRSPAAALRQHVRRNSLRHRGRETEGRRQGGTSQSSTSEGQNGSLSGKPGSVISGRAAQTNVRVGKFPRARALRKNAAISMPKSPNISGKDSRRGNFRLFATSPTEKSSRPLHDALRQSTGFDDSGLHHREKLRAVAE